MSSGGDSGKVVAPTDEERAQAGGQGMLFALYARLVPLAPAIISDVGNRSFRELNENANRLVRALRARGLRAGDSVALSCGNRPEFAEVMYGCMRAGFRFTPVNWHLTADEAAYIINDCEAKALIADADFAAIMAATLPHTPKVAVRLAIAGEITGFSAYADALLGQSGEDIADPVLGGRMMYTSGTTGRPKGVSRKPAFSAVRTASLTAAAYAPGVGQLHLCTGPLYHAAPLGLSMGVAFSEGVGIVLMQRWDAEQALALIEKHRITHTHMVPTMFHRMLRLPDEVKRRYDISSLKYVLHGAAPCPVTTKKALIDWLGPIVWEYYAATEGSGSSVGPIEWLKKPGTVGKPVTPDHVQIVDEAGELCPPNQAGTIYLKVAKDSDFTYHGDPKKTAAARRGDYFTLGDVGYLDEDGYLFLTDRSAHLIISGGVNIYPAEIEAVLLQHPRVHDAGVIGLPNEEWGEEVKAVVELAPGTTGDATLAAELIAFCRERLAHFKCPKSLDFTTNLPRHDNGKLYKQKLRADYRALAAKP
jgi:long-chain acyl-CoA synthetase